MLAHSDDFAEQGDENSDALEWKPEDYSLPFRKFDNGFGEEPESRYAPAFPENEAIPKVTRKLPAGVALAVYQTLYNNAPVGKCKFVMSRSVRAGLETEQLRFRRCLAANSVSSSGSRSSQSSLRTELISPLISPCRIVKMHIFFLSRRKFYSNVTLFSKSHGFVQVNLSFDAVTNHEAEWVLTNASTNDDLVKAGVG